MTDWTSPRRVVMESALLAQRGEYDKALRLLKDSLDEHSGSISDELVSILLCHAATISFQAGDLNLAEDYIRTNVGRFPNDPFALYLMAEVLERKGECDQSLSFASRSQEEALKQASSRSEAVLELVRHKWPGLAKNDHGKANNQ